MNCLVAGFDAFTDEPFNPSEAIVCSMPEVLEFSNKKISVQKLILPTCGDEAWPKLEQVLQKLTKNGPCVVVLLGLASKRSTICLERFALNIRDDKTLDNRGHNFVDETIDQEAATALRTNAPLTELVKHLQDKGFPAVISNHAGTFVCNEIYFRTLQYFGKLSDASLISFVHLPLPESYGKALAESQSKLVADNKETQMAAMQSAVQSILKYYLNYV